MTEDSLKTFFAFKHRSLCNLCIIRHAAFATCFVLTYIYLVCLAISVFLNVHCRFLGHISYVWLGSTPS